MNDRFRKKHLLTLLKKHDFEPHLYAIRAMSPKRVINPLIAFLCSADESVKWRSVIAIGAVVSDLAERERESARIIMRRLIWHLNDESGGIGWGVPEAMGEIMACSPLLAEEYGFMLVSYLRPGGNYIEHPMLQRGVLWGFGRLAHERPERVADGACLLPPYLAAEDPALRGLAAYAAGPLPGMSTEPLLRKLIHDPATLRLFQNGHLTECTVGQLAKTALQTTDESFRHAS